MSYIGNSLAQGLISGANIQDGTVDTPDIKDAAVTTGKIADSSVTTAKIAVGAVVTVDIADSAVTTAKIADASVTTAKIAEGAVVTADLADGAVTSSKMASGAAISNIGYSPTQRHGHGNGLQVTATGTPWVRIASVQSRFSYRVTVGTTGGWYAPGMTQFLVHRDWGNVLYVTGVQKLNAQYCTQVRANSGSGDGDWFLEVNFAGIHASSGNGSTLFDAYSYLLIEPMGPNSSVYVVNSGTVPTNPSSAGFISGPVSI